jgi:hypothetical protein
MLDLLDAVGSRITYPPDEQFPNWVEHLTTNDPFRQCNGNVGISDLVGLAASRGVTWYMAYKVYQGVDAECHILSDEATLHGSPWAHLGQRGDGVSQCYPLPGPLRPVDSAPHRQHLAGDWRNRI